MRQQRKPKHPRCERIVTEEWVAPGRGSNPLPPQHRTMRARCVLEDGHEPNKPTAPHIFGDWLEVKRLGA